MKITKKSMKKITNKKLYKCKTKGCEKKYTNVGLLQNHQVQEHEKIMVKFISLIDNVYQWGYEYEGKRKANEFRNSPNDYALQLGVLLRILEALRDIRYELRQEKKIVNL